MLGNIKVAYGVRTFGIPKFSGNIYNLSSKRLSSFAKLINDDKVSDVLCGMGSQESDIIYSTGKLECEMIDFNKCIPDILFMYETEYNDLKVYYKVENKISENSKSKGSIYYITNNILTTYELVKQIRFTEFNNLVLESDYFVNEIYKTYKNKNNKTDNKNKKYIIEIDSKLSEFEIRSHINTMYDTNLIKLKKIQD